MFSRNIKSTLRNLYNDNFINFVDRFIPREGPLSETGFKIYSNYADAFSNIEGIEKLNVYSRLSSHHLFILKINFTKFKISRQEFMSQLKKFGIITQVHYIPVNIHPYYQKLGYSPKSTPNAIKYYNEAISLPIFFDLTKYQQVTVINKIKNILKINDG